RWCAVSCSCRSAASRFRRGSWVRTTTGRTTTTGVAGSPCSTQVLSSCTAPRRRSSGTTGGSVGRVVQATPAGERTGGEMKIYVYPADEYGCGYYRLIWPAQALQAQGHDIQIVMPKQRGFSLHAS